MEEIKHSKDALGNETKHTSKIIDGCIVRRTMHFEGCLWYETTYDFNCNEVIYKYVNHRDGTHRSAKFDLTMVLKVGREDKEIPIEYKCGEINNILVTGRDISSEVKVTGLSRSDFWNPKPPNPAKDRADLVDAVVRAAKKKSEWMREIDEEINN